jgi:hypothetical protein
MRKLALLSTLFVFVPATLVLSKSEPLYIPSDPKAQYTVLSIKKASKNTKYITTLRQGPSGDGYSKRLVDCQNLTFKYIATSDTLAGLSEEHPDPSMSPIVGESISAVIVRYACSH